MQMLINAGNDNNNPGRNHQKAFNRYGQPSNNPSDLENVEFNSEPKMNHKLSGKGGHTAKKPSFGFSNTEFSRQYFYNNSSNTESKQSLQAKNTSNEITSQGTNRMKPKEIEELFENTRNFYKNLEGMEKNNQISRTQMTRAQRLSQQNNYSKTAYLCTSQKRQAQIIRIDKKNCIDDDITKNFNTLSSYQKNRSSSNSIQSVPSSISSKGKKGKIQKTSEFNLQKIEQSTDFKSITINTGRESQRKYTFEQFLQSQQSNYNGSKTLKSRTPLQNTINQDLPYSMQQDTLEDKEKAFQKKYQLLSLDSCRFQQKVNKQSNQENQKYRFEMQKINHPLSSKESPKHKPMGSVKTPLMTLQKFSHAIPKIQDKCKMPQAKTLKEESDNEMIDSQEMSNSNSFDSQKFIKRKRSRGSSKFNQSRIEESKQNESNRQDHKLFSFNAGLLESNLTSHSRTESEHQLERKNQNKDQYQSRQKQLFKSINNNDSNQNLPYLRSNSSRNRAKWDFSGGKSSLQSSTMKTILNHNQEQKASFHDKDKFRLLQQQYLAIKKQLMEYKDSQISQNKPHTERQSHIDQVTVGILSPDILSHDNSMDRQSYDSAKVQKKQKPIIDDTKSQKINHKKRQRSFTQFKQLNGHYNLQEQSSPCVRSQNRQNKLQTCYKNQSIEESPQNGKLKEKQMMKKNNIMKSQLQLGIRKLSISKQLQQHEQLISQRRQQSISQYQKKNNQLAVKNSRQYCNSQMSCAQSSNDSHCNYHDCKSNNNRKHCMHSGGSCCSSKYYECNEESDSSICSCCQKEEQQRNIVKSKKRSKSNKHNHKHNQSKDTCKSQRKHQETKHKKNCKSTTRSKFNEQEKQQKNEHYQKKKENQRSQKRETIQKTKHQRKSKSRQIKEEQYIQNYNQNQIFGQNKSGLINPWLLPQLQNQIQAQINQKMDPLGIMKMLNSQQQFLYSQNLQQPQFMVNGINQNPYLVSQAPQQIQYPLQQQINQHQAISQMNTPPFSQQSPQSTITRHTFGLPSQSTQNQNTVENHKEQIEAIEELIKKAKIKLDHNLINNNNQQCRLNSDLVFSKTINNEANFKISRNEKLKSQSSYNSNKDHNFNNLFYTSQNTQFSDVLSDEKNYIDSSIKRNDIFSKSNLLTSRRDSEQYERLGEIKYGSRINNDYIRKDNLGNQQSTQQRFSKNDEQDLSTNNQSLIYSHKLQISQAPTQNETLLSQENQRNMAISQRVSIDKFRNIDESLKQNKLDCFSDLASTYSSLKGQNKQVKQEKEHPNKSTKNQEQNNQNEEKEVLWIDFNEEKKKARKPRLSSQQLQKQQKTDKQRMASSIIPEEQEDDQISQAKKSLISTQKVSIYIDNNNKGEAWAMDFTENQDSQQLSEEQMLKRKIFENRMKKNQENDQKSSQEKKFTKQELFQRKKELLKNARMNLKQKQEQKECENQEINQDQTSTTPISNQELLAKNTKIIKIDISQADRKNDQSKQQQKDNTTIPINLVSRLSQGQKHEISKKDMLKLTSKNYEQLPEIKKKKIEESKKEDLMKRIANVKELEKKRRQSVVQKQKMLTSREKSVQK